MIIVIDYFTKWVEAEPLAKIDLKAQSFLWKHIICRFGTPMVVVSDNGTQFRGKKFKDLFLNMGIRQAFTSVAHPQTNGQEENVNRTLLNGLKTKLDAKKGPQPEYLDEVLWAYRTTTRVPTGETPFILAFGSEVVIPLEVGLPSQRVEQFDATGNEEVLRLDLDLLEERRDRAALRMETYKLKVARYYNSKFRPRAF